jgi:hypothetical protein
VLLIFVQHDKSGQAMNTALCEKDEEDLREGSASIALARCLMNSEKIKKTVKL